MRRSRSPPRRRCRPVRKAEFPRCHLTADVWPLSVTSPTDTPGRRPYTALRFLAARPPDQVGGHVGEGEAVALGRRGQQVEGVFGGAATLSDEDARCPVDDAVGSQGLLQLV